MDEADFFKDTQFRNKSPYESGSSRIEIIFIIFWKR
jgi:hypothetical protein